jgi:hypothetical protein
MEVTKLMHHFQRTYYTEPILMLVEFSALISGLVYARKNQLGRFFIFYIIVDLIILISYWFFILIPVINSELRSRILNIGNTIISLTELLVYCYFFRLLLWNNRIKKIISIFSIVYSILIMLFLITTFDFLTNRLIYVTNLLAVLEFLILMIPCFSYYQQILMTESKLRLFERPSFWIVTGIFFYSLISIPYYLLDTFIYEHAVRSKFIFNALLYQVPLIFHFLFLTIAFLCKKTLTI